MMLTPDVTRRYMAEFNDGDPIVSRDSTGTMFLIHSVSDEGVVLEDLNSDPPVRIGVRFDTLEEKFSPLGYDWGSHATS